MSVIVDRSNIDHLYVSSPIKGDDLVVTNCEVEAPINARGTLTISSSTCSGNIYARHAIIAIEITAPSLRAELPITIAESTIQTSVVSAAGIRAENCPSLGAVSSFGTVEIINCSHIHSVNSHDVIIQNSHISKHVHAQGKVTIENSIIGTFLCCIGREITINNCKIDTINIRLPQRGPLGQVFLQQLILTNCRVKYVRFEGIGTVILQGTKAPHIRNRVEGLGVNSGS